MYGRIIPNFGLPVKWVVRHRAGSSTAAGGINGRGLFHIVLEVIRALNKIKAAGVISDYAIGGAIAASFYRIARKAPSFRAGMNSADAEGVHLSFL